MKKIFAITALACAYPVFAQTICTTSVLTKFDPHQSQGPLERYISSRVHLPFFASEGKAGVVSKSKNISKGVWELEISPDITFQELNGWKPKKKLNAEDVVFSIQRQLIAFAKSVAGEESYIPAKISGLEKDLVSAKAKNSQTVVLTFRREVSLKDLERYFSSASGVIIPKEYAESGKPDDFFPAYGPFLWSSTAPSKLAIKLRDGKESQSFTSIRSFELTYKKVSENKCKRLYYAPPEIVEAAREKKIAASAIPMSSAKVYFRFNPTFLFAGDVSAHLSSTLSPDALPSLSKKKRSSSLFGTMKNTTAKKPGVKLPGRSAYVYYCAFPQLTEDEMDQFIGDFKRTLRDNLKLAVSMAPVDCNQLAGIRPAPDTLGVLNALEYSHQSEILAAFDCSKVSREIFGFCQEKAQKPEVIDRKLADGKRIYPIADLQSFLIESF